jgi:AcrR family transcriptional regulator
VTDNKEKRVSKVREMKIDLILDAALTVFSEKGFHETRLEDIAQEAGFSKASLYNYYKDKEMIFLSLAIREYELLRAKMKNDPLLKIDRDLPFLDNLRRILTLIFTTFGEHFSFILTLNSFQFLSIIHDYHNKTASEEVEEQFVTARSDLECVFVEVVNRAKERGEILSPMDGDTLHVLFDSVIFGTIREWHRNQKMGDIQATVDQLVHFLAKGFEVKE